MNRGLKLTDGAETDEHTCYVTNLDPMNRGLKRSRVGWQRVAL